MKKYRLINLFSIPLCLSVLISPLVVMADATELITTHYPWRGVQSRAAAISDNRQFVLFDSEARIFADDLNDQNDVFLRDRDASKTSLISHNRTGGSTDGYSRADDMTPDGRFVLYSTADTSWTGGFNLALVLLDRSTGVQQQVNLDNTGAPVRGYGGVPIILASTTSTTSTASDFGLYSGYGKSARMSADAQVVVFSAIGTIYVRDLATDTTDTINVPDQFIELSAISPDARYIVYRQGHRIEHTLFVHDRSTGSTRQVDVGRNGEAPNGQVFREAGISAEGRYVAFASKASNLVATDDNPGWDVFIRDMLLGVTSRISQISYGDSMLPSITPDGRYVTFVSTSQLVNDDYNGFSDIYRYDRELGSFERISVNHKGEELTTTAGWEVNSMAWGYGVSHRGDSIVFAGGWDFINPHLVYARDLCQNPNSTPVANIDLPESIIAKSVWTILDDGISAAPSQDSGGDRLEYHWTYPVLDYPLEYSPLIFNYNTDFYYGYDGKNIPAALPVGRHIFSLKVDDRCGDTDTTSRAINVNYNFDGYSSPIVPSGRYRIGKTLNIRFAFSYADGSFADDANVLLTINEIIPSSGRERTVLAVDGDFDRNGDRFDYTWNTTGMTTGWYRIYVNPRDGIGEESAAYPPYKLLHNRTIDIYLYRYNKY
jgi:Tol biopolymer transport system component